MKENIQLLVDLGNDIAKAMGEGAVAGVTSLTSGLEGLGKYIGENREGIQAFFNGMSIALSNNWSCKKLLKFSHVSLLFLHISFCRFGAPSITSCGSNTKSTC